MMRFLDRSLKYRLLVAFLLMGIIPYLFIMSYFSYWGRASILEQQSQRYKQQAEQSRHLIESRLSQLEREVTFISHLEVFDDLISIDVDYRISNLLLQKADIGEENPLKLYALDMQENIVSASDASMISKHYILESKKHFIKNDTLHLILALHSSFDQRELGYLVAEYPLSNLKRFMLNDDLTHYSIEPLPLKSSTSLTFDGVLKEFSLSYSVNEEEGLAFINELMLYLSMLLLVGVSFIYFLSYKFTKEIISPINRLTQATKEIISTKEYALRVDITNRDEIGTLSVMFNKLIQTTGSALDALSKENQMRTKRFIDLTDTFNDIAKTHNQEECIEFSIEKLHSILPYDMSFSKQTSNNEDEISLPLSITDFATQKQSVYGYLILEKKAYINEDEQRFFRSVTSMIMLQIERIAMIKKIQSASEAKTAFISGMSHELRTPLSAIIGFSQYLITYEELEVDQISTISKIEKAALHLLDIINGILDIAKIEAGKMELNLEEIHVESLLDECIDITSSLAEDKDIKIVTKYTALTSLHVSSDAKYFKQIIINLLSNAIKFTQEGSVTLYTSIKEETLTIKVIDTGVGLSKENLAKVFEEFVQFKNSGTTKQKGTGLGLPLSKHIAHALNAELTLFSKGEGYGSEAILEFNL